MAAIGSVLREARTKKAVSFEEIHAKIKIHPRVLQLLEEEKFERLPSPLYVKSFLKTYAEFLGVNADELIRIYEQEKQPDPQQTIYLRPAQPFARPHFRRKRLWATLSVVGIIAASVFSFFFLYRNVAPKGWAAPLLASPGPARKPIPGVTSKGGEWLRRSSMGNFPRLDKKTPFELRIKAIDNVWVRVTCDGKVLFQSILKRGAVEGWTAKQEIEVWTGNSSNMALSVNGYAIGSPGKGVIRKLVVNHDGVRIAS